jgi:hypothetical protein
MRGNLLFRTTLNNNIIEFHWREKTNLLYKASVEFFKEEARKHKTQYQNMIRRLLDEYTAHPL